MRSRLKALLPKGLQLIDFFVVIDETGDIKKGKRTDYVARQYLGSIGKIDQGIVSVNAYNIYQNITFPLSFRVFKPKETLKTGDKYFTKIELGLEIITELIDRILWHSRVPKGESNGEYKADLNIE